MQPHRSSRTAASHPIRGNLAQSFSIPSKDSFIALTGFDKHPDNASQEPNLNSPIHDQGLLPDGKLGVQSVSEEQEEGDCDDRGTKRRETAGSTKS